MQGAIIHAADWSSDCLPPPALYYIKEKAWVMLEHDPMEEDEYRGHSILVVQNVPFEVTNFALASWLSAGIDDDDPDLAVARQQLDLLEERLRNVIRQIKDLPKMTLSKTGMGGPKEELKLKQARANVLSAQKKELEEDVAELQGRFDLLKLARESVGDNSFSLRLAETVMPLQLNTWEVRFGNDPRSQRLAYIAAHKHNWSMFLLAMHKYNGSCLTGKGDIPRLTEQHKQVNMRTVTVARKKHGVGMFVFPDERGYYSGQWRRGLRHGTGTEVSQVGRYQGGFREDWRRGPGSMITATGDTLRGEWGALRHHTHESLLGGSEYLDGSPQGRMTAAFSDGSSYVGDWVGGVPCGRGRFVAASGLVVEGEFGRDSLLTGFGTRTDGDVSRMGLWKDGQLHGQGAEIDAVAGNYDGEWRRGEKCGFGVQVSSLCEGRYVGWWKNNMRWGHGTLNYGNITRDDVAEKKKREAILKGAAMRAAAAAEGASLSILGGEGEEEEEEGGNEEDGEGGGARAAVPRGAAASAHLLGPEAQMEAGAGAAGKGKKKPTAPTTQYALLLEETASMKYAGDYEYAGAWVAGVPRSGGCFTERRGRPEPHTHVAKAIPSGRPVMLPGGFADLDERERILAAQRWKIAQASTKLALDNRLAKEALNRQSFAHVIKEADKLLPEVRARNRAAKHDVDRIKQEVKRVVAKFDQVSGEAPEEALAVQDLDLVQMAEQEKDNEKIAPPLDVRDNLMV